MKLSYKKLKLKLLNENKIITVTLLKSVPVFVSIAFGIYIMSKLPLNMESSFDIIYRVLSIVAALLLVPLNYFDAVKEHEQLSRTNNKSLKRN